MKPLGITFASLLLCLTTSSSAYGEVDEEIKKQCDPEEAKVGYPSAKPTINLCSVNGEVFVQTWGGSNPKAMARQCCTSEDYARVFEGSIDPRVFNALVWFPVDEAYLRDEVLSALGPQQEAAPPDNDATAAEPEPDEDPPETEDLPAGGSISVFEDPVYLAAAAATLMAALVLFVYRMPKRDRGLSKKGRAEVEKIVKHFWESRSRQAATDRNLSLPLEVKINPDSFALEHLRPLLREIAREWSASRSEKQRSGPTAGSGSADSSPDNSPVGGGRFGEAPPMAGKQQIFARRETDSSGRRRFLPHKDRRAPFVVETRGGGLGVLKPNADAHRYTADWALFGIDSSDGWKERVQKAAGVNVRLRGGGWVEQ